MGKCIICGRDTNDFRCAVRKENGKSYDDYQCEECTMEKVRKAREEYERDFNEKLLPYLLDNNFKVIVEGGFEVHGKEPVEEYPVKDFNFMDCVGIIRNRMKEKGYYENWIDVHWEEYNGVEIEVVDYLCYSLSGDKGGETWISYNLELIGDNGLKLKARYC